MGPAEVWSQSSRRPGGGLRRWLGVLVLALSLAAAGESTAGPTGARAGASALAGIALPAGASSETVEKDGAFRIRGALLVHPDASDARAPVGSDARAPVALLLEMDPGWHIYWRNPGESGLPTRIETAATGAEWSPLAWPAPRAFREAEGLFTTFGYSERALWLSEVAGAADARIAVQVELLACRSECIPGRLELERSLAPTASERAAAPQLRALFEEAGATRPLAPADLDMALELALSHSALVAASPFRASLALRSCARDDRPECRSWAPAPGEAFFFPRADTGVEVELAGLESDAADPRRLWLLLEGRTAASLASPPRLAGVLALRDDTGRTRHVELDLPLPRAEAGEEVAVLAPVGHWPHSASPSSRGSLWTALALALLGGLVLNLMPCVLPVLAIKVVSVAEMAHAARREAASHGLAYLAGIAASMATLAAVVVGLRAAGTAVGWGFQFQEPAYLVAVCALLVAFALNLFGVFEIHFQPASLAGVGQAAVGARRSFFEGLLAVVLATPCTAPFLGTAVGFAFASSGAVIFAVFQAIGVGLALPFVVVSLMPGWGRFLPRAGAWMLTLRAALGFAVLASALWLLWLAGGALGPDVTAGLLASLLGLAFALWVFGQLQHAGRSAWARGLALLVLGAAAAAPLLVRLEPAQAAARRGADASDRLPFDPAAVRETVRAGSPALVVFTADWCLTCKVNERVVLADEGVARALREGGVVVFEADWTRRDERIRAELARFGRAGVPLYLVYAAGSPEEPVVLPELLSIDRVVAALQSASAPAVARRAERGGET